MNLLARARTFFQSTTGKRLASSVLMVALMVGATAIPMQLAFAQQGTPAPGANTGNGGTGSPPAPVRPNAPGPTQPTATNGTQPSGAPATRTATPASGTGAPQQGSSVIGAGVTSVDWSCGAFPARPDCLVQVAGAITTFIFSTIVYFLSKLLVLLTSVLIVFARYNKFNMAVPVDVGWAIARDIMNIFFIVALLASAFVTIIGKGNDYGLHYTKVVPQLFVGAILVNFSRTLMLLMIDASQVVTLTFISAFEGTIAGNTMQAFGITKIQSFQRSLGNTGNSPVNIIEIIVAYMLGIGLLTTAVTIIVIYVAYFIGRIVGLWLLIIVSPFYFAAETLPKKFGSIVSGATKEINGKITSLLIGGPQVAFFLWLAFATVQRVASSPNPTSAIGFDFDPNGTTGFLTQIGTAPEFGAFIIATALLAAGLKTVSSSASDVGMGSVVKTVSGYGEKAKSMLQRSPWTMTKAGAGYANQRLGITNRLATGISRGAAGQRTQGFTQGVGRAIGSGLGAIPGFGGMLAAGAAAGVGAVGAKKLAEDRKAIDARIKNLDSLPPQERAAAIRAMDAPGGDGKYSSLTTRAVAEAQHEALLKNRDADLKFIEAGETRRIQDEMLNRAIESARASGKPVPKELTSEQKKEAETHAKAIAKRKLQDDEAQRMERLQSFAEKANDQEAVERIKKERKKYMQYSDDKKYNERVDELLDNPDQLKDLDPDQLKSGRLAFAMMKAYGVTDDTAASIDPTRRDVLKEKLKDNKEMLATVDAMVKRIEGGGASKNELERSVRQKDNYGVQRLFSTEGNGGAVYSDKEKDALRDLRITGAVDRKAGGAFDANMAAAAQSAIRTGLPFEQVKALIDRGDGVALSQLAETAKYVVSTATTPEESVKQLAKYLKIAEQAKASGAQIADMINTVLPDNVAVDKFFGGYNKLTNKRREDAQRILSSMVRVEDSDKKIEERLEYIREYRFPPVKTTVTVLDPATGLPGTTTEERSRPSGLNAILG